MDKLIRQLRFALSNLSPIWDEFTDGWKFRVLNEICSRDPRDRYDNQPYKHNNVCIMNYEYFMIASGYFNASRITDKNGSTTHIVTQAPTVDDFPPLSTVMPFWLVVWQQKTNVIVALTPLYDSSGEEKCSKYWPSKGKTLRFPCGFTVEWKGEESLFDGLVIIRQFYLRMGDDSAGRTVTQIHYVGWPDMGVPESTNIVLDICSRADESSGDTPVIVHCSAGLGRAGTFTAIHSSIAEIRSGKLSEIDILDKVNGLREMRPGMVQTKVQFRFIYKAILDYLMAKIVAETNFDEVGGDFFARMLGS